MPPHNRSPVHEGKNVHRVADMTAHIHITGNGKLPDTLTIPLDQALASEWRAAVGKGRKRGDSRVYPREQGVGVDFSKCIRELIGDAKLDAMRDSS